MDLEALVTRGPVPGLVHVAEAGGCAGALLAARLLSRCPGLVYVTPDASTLAEARRDLSAFAPGKRAVVLPPPELSPFDGVRGDRTQSMARAAALARVSRGDFDVLLTSAAGWLRRVPPAEVLRRLTVELALGASVDRSALAARLLEAGYERAPLVEDPGTFSLRGDIVDVWPAGAPRPLRLDLEFERLVGLRSFAPDSQRSDPERLDAAFFPPTRETAAPAESTARARRRVQELCDAVSLPSARTRQLIEDALGGRALLTGESLLPALHDLVPLSALVSPELPLVFEDTPRVLSELRREREATSASRAARADEPLFAVDAHLVSEAELDAALAGRLVVALQPGAILGPEAWGVAGLAAASGEPLRLGARGQGELAARLESARRDHRGLEPLHQALTTQLNEGQSPVLTARGETQAARVEQLLAHRGLPVERAPAVLLDAAAPGSPGLLSPPALSARRSPRVLIVVAPLGRGMCGGPGTVYALTEEEVFGRRAHRPAKSATRALAAALDDLRSLRPGDHVVHREHGIGRYQGLEHRALAGSIVDLLVVEYRGGDRLYLPVYRLDQIQKYSGTEGAPPLDRLGGQTFAKTKAQARRRVRVLADQLLALYAERAAAERPGLEVPGDDYAAFAAAFPFEETADQAAAIEDVIRDLCAPRVMDRLICGDVGFGKTEVALRAAYLNVLAGRQVAVLCPTTVLAEQHLRTFAARLEPLGATVRSLSRFQTTRALSATLLGLKNGSVDVVVGTHRLLSKDVHLKRLGLLVVDEEQRFGVTHKERIKELRRSVDVLTLSATPIPRTLGMALAGLRDMSVIATAPVERRAVRTLTARFDATLVREALERELGRGGQAFYVYNRVEGLPERATRLRELVPDARVAVAHGQSSERELEAAMLGFVAGDYDILVSTAIIESGLDIPRANTLLVERADLLGLAQLYQLRGRVGRSAERGYCYLLLPEGGEVSEEARRRLEVLEQYTELGSGFRVAALDLELRGAGELLGADQSGFMERIGFELFTELLAEATAELSGRPQRERVDPELSVDVEALLPESYVTDVGLRLSLYKRYASAEGPEEFDALDDELSDRFGPPPEEARRLSALMRLRPRLRRLSALGLVASASSVTLHLSPETPLPLAELARCVARAGSGLSLSPDGRLTRRRQPAEAFPSGLEHASRLLEELDALLGPSPT